MDEELNTFIKGCIANDRRCQDFLYKKYYGTMLSMVKRYIKCPFISEEVLNNGYLRIFKGLSQFNYSGSFEGWMRKIMMRAVLDAIENDKRIATPEKRKRGNFLEFGSNFDTGAGEIITYDNDFFGEEWLYKLIDTLPIITSKVFKLYIYGYLHREIAQMLGITEGTSKWHLNKGRKLLSLIINK